MKKYRNIIDFIADKSIAYADDTCIHNFDGATYSYADFSVLIARSRNFLTQFSIARNDKVCILLPNIPEFLTLLGGLFCHGAVAVNLNIHLTPEEIKIRLLDAQVSMVVLTPEQYSRLAGILLELDIRKILLVADTAEAQNHPVYHLNKMQAPNGPEELTVPDFEEDAVAFLQYTGGTTGGIKAAMLTHGNILANVSQIRRHFGEQFTERGEVMISTFPYYHVFALTFTVFAFLNVGATCVQYPVTKDLPQLIRLMKQHPITCFVGVNTLYKLLMQTGQLSKSDLPRLKVCIGGGEHIQYSTKTAWQQLSGVPIYEAYGMTETSAMAIVNPISAANDLETIGVAIPDTQVKLLDEADREVQEDGIHGEILLKGPQVISQYWNKPEENVGSFKDGWLRTGDIAVWKNGRYLRIVDRKKDMISVSGFKVFPNEVESVMATYPGITDCAVVGEPDEQTGERVVLFYVSDMELVLEEVQQFCRQHVTAFKVPKRLVKISAIPKTAIGKTMRSSLRKILSV